MTPVTASALLTDLYQLTMAYGYWKSRKQEEEAVFHLFFRKAPFGGHTAIACGLEEVTNYLLHFHFLPDEIAYLATLRGNDGRPLFEREFLTYLSTMRFTGSIHAVPEGTVVLAYEPIIRVQGPIIQCQLIETALLNIVNFQTLIATKAARICAAAGDAPVLEFGLRRAQGPDGGLAASRAAYIGGCAATSNVLAGKQYDIPVKGTHAHSWVMSFDDELSAFLAYAAAMPHNCTFLVDTYDTRKGVAQAIEVGRRLRDLGHKMVGIRLDSGDLASLSIMAREMLDEAGFFDAAIVASNDLDEHKIKALRDQGAKISAWGVGTRLVTGHDQGALGGVYKLSAIRKPGEAWKPKIKLSEDPAKNSLPGCLQVMRTEEDGLWKEDLIFDEWEEDIEPQDGQQCLLQEIIDQGKLVFLKRNIHQVRQFAAGQMALFRQVAAPNGTAPSPLRSPALLKNLTQLQALKGKI